MTQPRHELLTQTPIGRPVVIEAVSSSLVHDRLRSLGIGIGEELVPEQRGDYGDLIVGVAGRYVHVPEHLARRVRVRPAPLALSPVRAPVALRPLGLRPIGLREAVEAYRRERQPAANALGTRVSGA